MREMRVLLVDDEEELVSTMAERLSLRGIGADWASNADEALMKLDSDRFDVVVLDVKMPKIGGLELKKLMERKYLNMKFIFLTGHGSATDFRAGSAEAGPEFYLVKPVGIEDLIGKMREAIEK